jgi:hypothetical protein
MYWTFLLALTIFHVFVARCVCSSAPSVSYWVSLSVRNAAAAIYPFTRGHSEHHFYSDGLVERVSQFCLPVIVSVLNSACVRWSSFLRFRSLAESLLTARLSSRVRRSMLCVSALTLYYCLYILYTIDGDWWCLLVLYRLFLLIASIWSWVSYSHRSSPAAVMYLYTITLSSAPRSHRPWAQWASLAGRSHCRPQRRCHTCTHCTSSCLSPRGHPPSLIYLWFIRSSGIIA